MLIRLFATGLLKNYNKGNVLNFTYIYHLLKDNELLSAIKMSKTWYIKLLSSIVYIHPHP